MSKVKNISVGFRQGMAKLVVQPDVVEFMEHIFLQQKRDIKVDEVSCSHSVLLINLFES